MFDERGLYYMYDDKGLRNYGDSLAENLRYLHIRFIRCHMGIEMSDAHSFYKKELTKLYQYYLTEKKELIRAPKELLPPEWPTPEKDIPFDQLAPFVITVGAFEDLSLVRDLFKQHQERNWRLPNGDLSPLHLRNVFYRALKRRPFILSDIGLYATAMACCGYLPSWDAGLREIQWGDGNDVENDINLIHCFLQCEYRGHTWISRKAKEFYSKNRNINKVIKTYYLRDFPEMIALMTPVINRIFYGK